MEKFRIFLAELFELEKEALFYWSAVLYGTGVGIYFSLSFEPPLAPVILGLAVLFLVQYFVRARAALLLGLRALLILLAGFGAGALRTSLVDTTTLSRETWAIALEGVVSVAEQRIEDGLRLTLKGVSYPENPGQTLPGKIRIVVRTQAPELGPGDVIRTRAVLMPLPGPVLPGGYDFGRQLWFRGLGAVGFAVAPVEAVSRPERILEEKIGAFRQKMWLRITTAVPGENGAVAAALITGIRDGIPERVSNNMRIAGLAHLLAISGLHMALITGVLFFALRAGMAFFPKLALKHPIRKYAAIGAFIGASGYLVLSGASISTQRAFIMVSIVLLAVLTDRKAISMRSVTLAAVAILTFTPEAVLHPSFQMSFAAVTGLVAGYAWAQPYLNRLFRANPGFLARAKPNALVCRRNDRRGNSYVLRRNYRRSDLPMICPQCKKQGKKSECEIIKTEFLIPPRWDWFDEDGVQRTEHSTCYHLRCTRQHEFWVRITDTGYRFLDGEPKEKPEVDVVLYETIEPDPHHNRRESP
ncbi:MAG: ComEC/Rec2 family competence protein [Proteobacteria bacterium]|nr:ComEC/Rec2 family competence protein [Pseudomonadota bacterium]